MGKSVCVMKALRRARQKRGFRFRSSVCQCLGILFLIFEYFVKL